MSSEETASEKEKIKADFADFLEFFKTKIQVSRKQKQDF